MESELEKLRRLLSTGVISESEFTRAEQLVRATQPIDPPKQDVASRTDDQLRAEPAKESPAVAPARPWMRRRWLVASFGAVGVLAAVILAAVNGSPDGPSGAEPAPQPRPAVQVTLTDRGIGPLAWGSTKPQVLAWLRDQLGPEQVLTDVADPEMCGGATVTALWVDGYSFYVIFSSRGLLGYRLADGPSTDRSAEALARFVGPSELAIRSSLEDIRNRFPQVALRERQDDPDWPNRVRAFIGGQMLELSDDTFDVWAISAGRARCSAEEIDADSGGVPVTIDSDGQVVRVETPAPSSSSPQPEGITLRADGLGDVPFGTHPDIILSWVEERLGPPITIRVSRDLYCPSGLIADAQWEELVLFFYRGRAEEDAAFNGPGFARSDTFGGYLHEPTDGTTDASATGVFTTAEGIGPGVTLAALLAAYPDAVVFDAVKADEDGSPYGDRPPSFRTSSGLAGDLTGTDPSALVLWVSGGTAICGG